MIRQLFIFSLLLVNIAFVVGDDEIQSLECYVCVNTDGDSTCEDDPDSYEPVSTIDCEYGEGQCCGIQRRDLNEDKGNSIEFSRLCLEDCDPDLIGKMIETPDWTATTYQTYCDEPKCNTGPGNVQPGSNNAAGIFIDGIQGVDGSSSLRGPASIVATGTLTAAVGGRVVHEAL